MPLGTYAPVSPVPLQVAGLTTRLPRLQVLAEPEVEAYWEALGRASLRQPYGSRCLENQYGTSFDIPADLAERLVDAVRTLDGLLKRYIRKAGGLTAWLRGRVPTFGERPLNFAAVNRPVEERLLHARPRARMLLPFSLDLVVTAQGDTASLRVVELQTGLGYCDILQRQLAALGHDPEGPTAWAGRSSPREVLARVARDGATGADDAVSLLATFPSQTQNLRDEVGWARSFSIRGAPDGFFLATDLERDAEGYWHLEYALDPVTGLPLLDGDDRPLLGASGRRRRIRRVMTMQTQLEIDHIHARLDPAKRAVFEAFLADGEAVSWLFPNAAWYIADKSLMGRFRADLRAEGSAHADLFTPCHVEGERLSGPGSYVVKPVRGVGGKGIRSLDLAAGEPFEVPPGFIAQQRFTPFPLEIQLSRALSGAFPLPRGAPLHEAHLADPRLTTATLELRIFSLPGSTEQEDAYVFMARAAPTWDPSDPAPTAPVLTNMGRIQDAIWASPLVNADNHRQLPFGWCAVTVGASDRA